MTSTIDILCCYAHEDDILLQKLKAHFMPLQRQGLITLWVDTDINAGSEWEKEIKKHLGTAQIILLLISSGFMSSDYCYSVELKQAIERHERGEARIIPIILRSVYWQGAPFGRLQALPKEAKPITSWPNLDDALFDVAEGVRKAIKEMTLPDSSPPNDEIKFIITSPKEGSSVPVQIMVRGTAPNNIPKDKELWLLVQSGGVYGYFPQGDAFNPNPIVVSHEGKWNAIAYVGIDTDPKEMEFILQLALADQKSASRVAIDQYFASGQAGKGYNPLYPLPDGIELVAQTIVKRA
jgi:hypothetical protein